MLAIGPARKVTIYVNEDSRHHAHALYESVLALLMQRGVAGATATRALAGFGSHRVLHTPNLEAAAFHMPIRIEFVESAETVAALLPTLYDMVNDGLIEVQDTRVVRASIGKEPESRSQEPAHTRRAGAARLMRIYMDEDDRWHDEPLYSAIVKQLRMMQIAGATVYRGILGYGAKGHTHRQSFFHVVRDLPVMISVIDSEEKLSAAAPVIEGMLHDGMIVISDVEMVRIQTTIPSGEAPNDARLPAR